ncbi:deoxyguanosinetriphosphate triphosphohydrolase [Kineococcus rhizosphaerae]|uniref:Deoxyguanosinetriphosphate triphosphohydrolase-like protein n=1 Tax=Kineococcus rhizosphaerae TaxID=559628 RepID=A0A2T0R825_9ACTN|nr:deoxyguanosinetriphosphate triphosphohydrolase [Kineococcus rhizosphaerae]PRY17319.1 dGTPase [Kineococcus rhizosphaerae]
MSGYGDQDTERWASEPPKKHSRSAFARDRARVLHSSALRRLAAKTQVVGPSTDDFVRNRLTHSLEVAQVGRELGAALGCDPDVVDTACLAHDLGHPPFGHNGERALAEAAADIGGFEGNAQTLRILTRLEPKSVAADGSPVGLNLTRASLDASTKYPWLHGKAPRVTSKFGAYADDADVFAWLRDGAPENRPCVEAQVMDFADDVAYSVHDVEDAVVAGHVRLDWLQQSDIRARVAAQVRDWYVADATDEAVGAALQRLSTSGFWAAEEPGEVFGGRRHLAALKDMTSQLIGRFANAAEHATRERHGDGRLTRYAAEVVVPAETALEVAVLKGVAATFVMSAQERQPFYARQRELLHELLAALVDRGPDVLEPPFREDHDLAADDAGRLRVVVDQVASLTDVSALAWHERLTRSLQR